MKILFLIGGLSVQDGGTANEIVRLSELLCSDGNFQITVGCLTPKHKSIGLNKRIKYVEFKGFNILSFTFFEDLRQLSRLICENDVVYCTGIWGPIDGLACRISINNGKPTYIRVCGMLEPYIIKRNWLKKRLAFQLYLKNNLFNCTGIIVNSHSEALNVIKLGISPTKVKIIPPSVSMPEVEFSRFVSRKELSISSNDIVLLYLGRIHPKKGLHLLMPALAIVKKRISNLKLLIAGEFWNDSYKAEIIKLVDELQLQDAVQFSGLVVGNKKIQHFNAADLFVLPSQSEGLPNAVIEAMSYGMPVIISPGCNIPEVEDYQCGIITEMSIQPLANAILALIENLTVLEYSKNCKKLISEKFCETRFLHDYKVLSTVGLN